MRGNRFTNRLRCKLFKTGPYKYFDLMSFFFFIKIPALWAKRIFAPCKYEDWYFARITRLLQTCPFRLDLNLNPLYSIRGGSTTRTEPLIKYDGSVFFRKKPLYRWNVRSHRTLVLSVINSHVWRWIIFFFFSNPNTGGSVLLFNKILIADENVRLMRCEKIKVFKTIIIIFC